MTTLPDETPELAAAVPARLLTGLREYGLHHRPVGGFLTAVLENDLMRAVGNADPESLFHLRNIVVYVVNVMPGRSWGSPEKVKAWVKEDQP